MVVADQFASCTALCADCTNGGFAFLASPFSKVPADKQFASVQLLFLCRFCREFARISIVGIYSAMVVADQFASSYRFVR